MWNYEKRLQFPVNIKEPNAKLAQVIISQFGGPDGELAASMRYLSQKFATPYKEVAGLLNDIGTEELAHLEMIGAIVYQLTRNLSMDEIEKAALTNIMWTIPLVSGLRQRAVFPLMPVNFSPRGMSSPIWLRIWLPSRRHAPPMTIFSAW